MVYRLYLRKRQSHFVNQVFPTLGLEQLDAYTIAKARRMASGINSSHAWKEMTDEELLRSAHLILRDPETGLEGITLAAVLLFGREESILSLVPQHRTGAIFRLENIDRCDDREVILSNLLTSYERLIAFGQKHLNDLFVMDGIFSVNARDWILREIVSNTLAHRNYADSYPARMIIDNQKILVENGNIENGFGVLDPKRIEPYAKNPPISRVFREIGLADELGSGMRNTYKYTKLYSGKEPIFEEGYLFRTVIPLRGVATKRVGGGAVFQETSEETKDVMKAFILREVQEDNRVTRKDIAQKLGVTVRTVGQYIQDMDNLTYIGRGRHGHWRIEE